MGDTNIFCSPLLPSVPVTEPTAGLPVRGPPAARGREGKPCPQHVPCPPSRDWEQPSRAMHRPQQSLEPRLEHKCCSQSLTPSFFLPDFSMVICSLVLLFSLPQNSACVWDYSLFPCKWFCFTYSYIPCRSPQKARVKLCGDFQVRPLSFGRVYAPHPCSLCLMMFRSRMTRAETMYTWGDLGPAYSFTKWSEKISEVPHLCLAFVSEISLEVWREKSIMFHKNTSWLCKKIL